MHFIAIKRLVHQSKQRAFRNDDATHGGDLRALRVFDNGNQRRIFNVLAEARHLLLQLTATLRRWNFVADHRRNTRIQLRRVADDLRRRFVYLRRHHKSNHAQD